MFVGAWLAGSTGPAQQAVPPRRAVVEVDAVSLDERGPPISEQVNAKADSLFTEQDVVVGERGADPTIFIFIEPLPDGETGYLTTSEIQHEGDVVEGSHMEQECRLCTEAELVNQVEATLRTVIPLLPSPEADDPAGPVPAGPGPDPDPDPVPDPVPGPGPDGPPPPRLTALGKGGDRRPCGRRHRACDRHRAGGAGAPGARRRADEATQHASGRHGPCRCEHAGGSGRRRDARRRSLPPPGPKSDAPP